MVLCDETANDDIHGKAEGSAVERRDGKYSPCPERLQNRPQKCGVPGEKVFDGVQEWMTMSLRETETAGILGVRARKPQNAKTSTDLIRHMFGSSRQNLYGMWEHVNHRLQ